MRQYEKPTEEKRGKTIGGTKYTRRKRLRRHGKWKVERKGGGNKEGKQGDAR